MSTTILLFYSNKCPHSRQFLEKCEQYGIQSMHRICVDNTPRGRIPTVVKSVPALVFSGSNQSMQGDQAFQWLEQQIHQKQQKTQQRQQSQLSQSNSTGTVGNAQINGEPLAWQSTEMGSSFSDTYSFIDNSFTETGQAPTGDNGGSGSTIPKNFSFLSEPNTVQPQQQQPLTSPTHPLPPNTNTPSNMRGMIGQPQQQNTSPQRNGAPSGYGRMPPTATMAPPSNRPETDELSKRMESFRMSREQDVPPPIQRLA